MSIASFDRSVSYCSANALIDEIVALRAASSSRDGVMPSVAITPLRNSAFEISPERRT